MGIFNNVNECKLYLKSCTFKAVEIQKNHMHHMYI